MDTISSKSLGNVSNLQLRAQKQTTQMNESIALIANVCQIVVTLVVLGGLIQSLAAKIAQTRAGAKIRSPGQPSLWKRFDSFTGRHTAEVNVVCVVVQGVWFLFQSGPPTRFQILDLIFIVGMALSTSSMLRSNDRHKTELEFRNSYVKLLENLYSRLPESTQDSSEESKPSVY